MKKQAFFQVVTASYFKRALTHNASKDIPENESPNAYPQDYVDLDYDRICHLHEISQDVVPMIQCEELKQSNKCIPQGTVLTELHTQSYLSSELSLQCRCYFGIEHSIT